VISQLNSAVDVLNSAVDVINELNVSHQLIDRYMTRQLRPTQQK
jgi:hypothetical protein